MNKIVKRKLKKEIKLLFILVLIIISIVFYKSFFKNKNENIIKQEDKIDYVTNDSEIDNDIIANIFANGMNVEDYKKIYNFTPELLKSYTKYSKIDYNFEKSLTYYEIEQIIKKMNNSNIVKTYILGQTHDNRNIYNIEIGSGKKILLLDANMHAAESANTPLLLKFLIDILNDYESGNETIKKLLSDVKISAIPCVNPDGYEVYNFGIEAINNKNLWIYQNKDTVSINHFKYNANGVDLNRNFPTQNGGLYYKENKLLKSVSLKKTTKRYTYFGGEILGSEPEVRIVMYHMLKNYKNSYAYINMHSQGRLMYCGKPNLSKEYNDITISLCKRMAKITNYRVYGLDREEVGEGNDGTASDFMAELANGFIFSSKTGRLSSKYYKKMSGKLVQSVPAIVLETMNDNYKNPKYYKNEYYSRGLKDMFYDLVQYVYEQ